MCRLSHRFTHLHFLTVMNEASWGFSCLKIRCFQNWSLQIIIPRIDIASFTWSGIHSFRTLDPTVVWFGKWFHLCDAWLCWKKNLSLQIAFIYIFLLSIALIRLFEPQVEWVRTADLPHKSMMTNTRLCILVTCWFVIFFLWHLYIFFLTWVGGCVLGRSSVLAISAECMSC